MSHIFISYSRKDLDSAEKIVSALAKNDLNAWIDWKSIPKGEKFINEIYQGIESADVFLFLISPDSIVSDWCNAEIKHAAENNKRIIPVSIRDTKNDNILPEIAERHWIFCRDEKDKFDIAITEILETIAADYEWVKYHTKLQVNALEWEKRNKKSGLLSGAFLREAQELITLSGQKDPQPTDLQRLFVNESQKNEIRNRSRTLAIAVTVITALTILSFFANSQRLLARANEATAQANLAVAQTAQIDAENQKATAIANEEEAKKQANIAIARSLILEAKSLNSASVEGRVIRGLLSILSMKLSPSSDGAGEMQNITYTQSINKFVLSSADPNYGIYSVALSPDGRYLAATGAYGEFQLWDKNSGNEIKLSSTDITNATSISFSPDSKYIAIGIGGSAEDNSGVQIYEVETRNRIQTIYMVAQNGPILFTADSRYLATSGYYKQGYKGFCVWDITTEIAISCMSHNEIGSDVTPLTGTIPIALSPDGNLLASASREDRTVKLWNVLSKQETFSYTFNQFAESVLFSHDGKYLIFSGCEAVSSTDAGRCTKSSMKVLEISTLNERFQMTHDGSMSPIAISPDGQFIATGSFGSTNGTAIIWNAITGNEISQLDGTFNATSIAFSPDSKYLVTGGSSTQIWRAATGDLVSEFSEQQPGAVSGYIVTFGPDSKTVLSAGYLNTISILQVDNPIEVKQITLSGGISDTAYSPDGKYIAFAGYYDHMVHVWDIDKDQEVLTKALDAPVIYVALSPGNKFIAATSNDGVIRVWNITSGEQILNIQAGADISPLIFSSDGNQIISGNRNWDISSSQENTGPNSESSNITAYNSSMYVFLSGGMAFVIDRESGNEIFHKSYPGEITHAALSPNDQLIAASECKERDQYRNCDLSIIHILEISSGEEISNLPYLGDVMSIYFSPDSKYIASSPLITSGIQGGAIDIREISTRQIIYHLDGSNFLRVADFSPDGEFIIAIDCEKTDDTGNCTQDGIRILKWKPEDIIEATCNRMPRNLTQSEWNQYIGNALPYQAICDNLPIDP